jgi:hypothetical protein
VPADPGTGAPQTDHEVAHAPNAWNTLMRELTYKLPRNLKRARLARERIRRLR